MALKRRVWTLLDIGLRVPPILCMDAALNYGHAEWGASLGWSVFAILLYIQVFLTALLVFFFNTKQLILIYIRIASIIIIIVTYETNTNYVNFNTSDPTQQELYSGHFTDIITLLTLATLFSITNTVNLVLHCIIWMLFFTPFFACMLPIPLSIIQMTPIVSATGCVLSLIYSMWLHGLQVCETVYNSINWCHSVVENYGLYTMIETHWVSLHIPQVFQAYWTIRLFEYILENVKEKGLSSVIASNIIKETITDGSENIIALLGMTSVISFLSQKFSYLTQAFLQVKDPGERNIGNITAVLFLILSMQSGVTRLDPETRYNRICRNLCLIFTALLNFIYNIINPTLLSLSASNHPSKGKHIRSLTVAGLLILMPTIILVYQWRTEEPNTWLLAITSFMTELIIKTLVSIMIYILFVIDAYKNGLWENLDDYVHYLKATAGSTEFLIGIYLFINGLFIFTFESISIIRACMICLHVYFNIYIQGKRGWDSYQLRNTALKKINILPEATPEQLWVKKDVCAICYQDLNSARITKCNHFFHGICLRKWLNVQDRCPLCHSTIYTSK